MDQKKLIEDLNKYWKDNQIFEKSVNQRSDKLQSITYDGPPFASWSPHFWHGLVSAMKDLIGRYKTMKWYKVVRDRWRDCHGLPVEKYVEKKLWIDGKRDIEEKIWVEKFIEECRSSVSNTSDEWRIFIDQIWRRADMDHAYFTMDLDYMQSVIRVFQNMYNQNLVYKWFKVQRYCPSCATTLANNEVNEWYKDRQDPAITIKFKIDENKTPIIHLVNAIIKNEEGWILSFFSPKYSWRQFPWWKVELWEKPEDTIKREIKEELGVDCIITKHIWTIKTFWAAFFLMSLYEVDIIWQIKNIEDKKHSRMEYVMTEKAENKFWFSYKVANIIIDDEKEICNFPDILNYHNLINNPEEKFEKDVNILAWTTTPRTLPSNMFLAVGKEINYCLVFDKSSKEYYILAENLIKQYYKDANEYILINILKWKDLSGIKYEPLFPYIDQSHIDKNYKDKFFEIINWDFVSTEDGTWIVHIAPASWQEDYDAVTKILPKEDSKNWLFITLNDYGEFTNTVPDREWIRVYDANKDIITKLKNEKKLIWQKSYSHSYPHCRRCETPLVSKAITSRFIKEQELTKTTVPNAEKIEFVPQTVKNRFIETLKSAPDWNLSRNRYRWCPLPVRENTKDMEDRIVLGTLDEIYQKTINWSANITKLIFIRHGKSDYNFHHLEDSYGSATLNPEGGEQATQLAKDLSKARGKDIDNMVFVISPLQRDFLTIEPYFQKTFGKTQAKKIREKYYETTKLYQKLFDQWKLYKYIISSWEKNRFEIWENIYVDFRTMELFMPDYQDKYLDIEWKFLRNEKKYWPHGESTMDLYKRTEWYILEITEKFRTKTIVTVSHAESILMMIKRIRDFDFNTKRNELKLDNAEIRTHYRDNNRNTEVDLHKPYVDNYRFFEKDNEYRRVTEVMDCRFESGSMPFGQVWYIWVESRKSKVESQNKKIKTWWLDDLMTWWTTKAKPLIYPADFIIEWLDQTRWWFRTMHINGNAVMKKNSFNNVIINWLVLAEDGKKMSKKLNNYPEPAYLFYKYWSDAYRLYLLSSPAVRAEPFRFSEKWVDQVFKDYTSAIINTYKFFETYAKIDNFVYDKPTVYFLRHWESEKQWSHPALSAKAVKLMKDKVFIEKILRVNPDIIYSSNLLRAIQTAENAKEIIKQYTGKQIEIKIDQELSEESQTLDIYNKILESESWKNVLIVSHEPNFQKIRSEFYWEQSKNKLDKLEIIKLPTYKISNELDRRILAELNNLGIEVDKQMDQYFLDSATKLVMWFIDKLNNRFIRRSRRRFRWSWMNDDKISAYNTLFEVISRYTKICAPFTPFITEHIYLELQNFTNKNPWNLCSLWDLWNLSIHLEHLPIPSNHYINETLLEEINLVRRIISLGLFIRAKNNIKVKQPLKSLEIC